MTHDRHRCPSESALPTRGKQEQDTKRLRKRHVIGVDTATKVRCPLEGSKGQTRNGHGSHMVDVDATTKVCCLLEGSKSGTRNDHENGTRSTAIPRRTFAVHPREARVDHGKVTVRSGTRSTLMARWQCAVYLMATLQHGFSQATPRCL